MTAGNAWSLPDLTQLDLKYSIGSTSFHEKMKVRGIAIAEEKVFPRHSCRWWPYCESSCPKDACFALLCSALLCPPLP